MINESVKLTLVSAMSALPAWCARSDGVGASDKCLPLATGAVAGIAGVAVAAAVGSPIVGVGAVKDVVTVKVEVDLITLPLIRCQN